MKNASKKFPKSQITPEHIHQLQGKQIDDAHSVLEGIENLLNPNVDMDAVQELIWAAKSHIEAAQSMHELC
jgi:hypothetical protein